MKATAAVFSGGSKKMAKPTVIAERVFSPAELYGEGKKP